MSANAKNPDRVFDKVRECRFFLEQMTAYERTQEIDKFLYCVSGFLSAFRTVAYRMYGVIENKKGKQARRALQNRLHIHPEIGFLIQRSNVEVHEDGVLVYPRFIVQVTASIPDRWKSKWAADNSKWQSRFTSRFDDVVGVRRAPGWQFAGNPKNLVDLCCDALTAMEECAQQALATVI
jgi:hypothetical protein